MDKETWIISLVRRYERPLCSYAFGLLRNLEWARDAVQDTFLRLCGQKPEKLKGREVPWLFRVCRNRSLDILRKEKPSQSMSEPQEASLPLRNELQTNRPHKATSAAYSPASYPSSLKINRKSFGSNSSKT